MAKKKTDQGTTEPVETMDPGTGEMAEERRLRRIRYEFVLRAELPIAHLAENIGNEGMLMRRKIRQRGGFDHVPIITGDTMRHGLREAAAYALLDAAGMTGTSSLTEAGIRLLFAGGMVTGKGDSGAVSLDQYRELCELVPTMALFGGCAQNRVIPGRLTVEDATLICRETENDVPAWATAWAAQSMGPAESHRAHVEEAQRVRMDPMLLPEKRQLLASSEQVRVNEKLLASEAASNTGDAIERAETKSTMLPRKFERIVQGSYFFWAVEARAYTELDVDVFHVACAAFLANAVVGGKRATGHGRLRAVVAQSVELARPREAMAEIDPTALAPQMGKLFQAHVAERRSRIVDFLRRVAA